MYYLLEILRFAFADVEQTLINFIQTSTDHARDWVYTYSKEKLMNEGTEGKRNKYTRVTNYEKGQGESWQKIIDITKEEDDLRFEESSKIPVMTGDWYNAAVGHIDIFDVNFLTGNKNHDEGSIWMIIRNFAVACINITIYAASAIILITLFINTNIKKEKKFLQNKQKSDNIVYKGGNWNFLSETNGYIERISVET